jgi:hypothetical protein
VVYSAFQRRAGASHLPAEQARNIIVNGKRVRTSWCYPNLAS